MLILHDFAVEESITKMAMNEDTGSPGWGASFFMQTTDVARAVAAAATAVRSPRPSVVFSSKDENGGGQLQRLQRQVSKMIKGFTQPPEVRLGTYNPEVLTSQKRQWANFQLQYLVRFSFKCTFPLLASSLLGNKHLLYLLTFLFPPGILCFSYNVRRLIARKTLVL